jgi:sugar lactone lactonase YvrE
MKRIINALLILLVGIGSANAQDVSTLSGGAKEGISYDGVPFQDAKYMSPWGMAYDSHNNLYIVDAGNNGIVFIHNDIYYQRGGFYTGGYKDGGGAGGSLMAFPNGIAAGLNDTIYFTDFYNNAVRRMDPFVSIGKSQVVKSFAGGGAPTTGDNGEEGYQNDMGLDARFSGPSGIAISPDKKFLLVADVFNGVIRKVMISGTTYGKVTTFAGDASKAGTGAKDGSLTQAVFSFPMGLAIAPNGDVYVADLGGGIRLISGGKVTTLVKNIDIENPTAVAYSKDYLYIGNGCNIKRYSFDTKQLMVLAGAENFIVCGHKDASDTVARFNTINSLIVSSDEKSLLVSDSNSIRMLTLPQLTVVDPFSNEETGITLYPNPARDHLYIRLDGKKQGEVKVMILDMNGRAVKEITLPAGMQQSTIDVSSLKSGAYIVSLSGAQFSASTGLILSK